VWRGARASADFGRPVAAENPVGQRMTTVEEEEDTTTTMAADQGRKSAKC
jgi:hypothetical protein